jgi:methylase of polypeptide subunit release factors
VSNASEPSSGDELEAELREALAGDLDPWKTALHRRPWADPISTLCAHPDREREIAGAAGFDDIAAWLTNAAEWVDTMHVPGHEPSPAEQVLRITWEFVVRHITQSLMRSREPSRLPTTGGVLAFVDGLDLCLVVDYRFVAETPGLRVIEAIKSPRTVFDVVDTLLHRPHETRTELKRMLQSSHRLVWHRDVLIHVDRREEPRVFGPSIDTLHLAELIAARYARLPPDEHPRRVLELGTGSGLLTATVLRNLGGVDVVTGIEIDPSSAFCTHRNWRVNTDDLAGVLDRKASLVVGPYRPELLAGCYDLVICNPPYIPEDPAAAAADPHEGRHGAVAGLELLDGVLRESASLVCPGGTLLLVVSSVTPAGYVAAPDGFTAEWPWGENGMPVLFEVEEVFARPAWIQRLLEAGGLGLSGDYYEHRLHAVWMTQTEET